ncbi:hypothetical protein ACHQM5_014503 [Ranunculus cassubicifolius]
MAFLYSDDLDDQTFLPKPIPPVILTSFVPYTTPPKRLSSKTSSNTQNVHKRMSHFLKRNQTNSKSIEECQDFHKDRCYRHMINERLRRGKQKRTYAAIHSLLPPGTKDEKASILEMAALHLQELKFLKETLQNRNRALEENAVCSSVGRRGTNTYRLRRKTPLSGIDSMIGVLKSLKNMGLKARSIHSEFSTPPEFFTVMEIESKIEAVDVEKAVDATLAEVERTYILDLGITSTE